LTAISKVLQSIDGKSLAPLRRGESVTLSIEGTDFALAPEDVLVSTQQAAEWVAADDRGVQIALSLAITPELKREGMARDFVRQVQQLRKDADLEIENRIHIFYVGHDADVIASVTEWSNYIQEETLAVFITQMAEAPDDTRQVLVGESQITLWIERTS
jgi:isoleucyl-tRNA synthetase